MPHAQQEQGHGQVPQHTPPPKPDLNGGLYTGTPFSPDAPWRNFPAVPDTAFLTHYNLRSARPPPGALFQYPGGGYRPGNNWSPLWGVGSESAAHDIRCAPCTGGASDPLARAAASVDADAPPPSARFAKYAYL